MPCVTRSSATASHWSKMLRKSRSKLAPPKQKSKPTTTSAPPSRMPENGFPSFPQILRQLQQIHREKNHKTDLSICEPLEPPLTSKQKDELLRNWKACETATCVRAFAAPAPQLQTR